MGTWEDFYLITTRREGNADKYIYIYTIRFFKVGEKWQMKQFLMKRNGHQFSHYEILDDAHWRSMKDYKTGDIMNQETYFNRINKYHGENP